MFHTTAFFGSLRLEVFYFLRFFFSFFSASVKTTYKTTTTHFLCAPMIATYFLHCFGDMGAQCWKTSVLVGIIIGAANATPKQQLEVHTK
jgi:hypothetical protein